MFEQALESINKFWSIIIAICAIIFGYVQFRFKVEELEKDLSDLVKSLDDKLDDLKGDVNGIGRKVANVQDDVTVNHVQLIERIARLEGKLEAKSYMSKDIGSA